MHRFFKSYTGARVRDLAGQGEIIVVSRLWRPAFFRFSVAAGRYRPKLHARESSLDVLRGEPLSWLRPVIIQIHDNDIRSAKALVSSLVAFKTGPDMIDKSSAPQIFGGSDRQRVGVIGIARPLPHV